MRTDIPRGYDQEKTQAPPDDWRANQARDTGLCDQIASGQPARALSNAEILEQLFSYHPPTEEKLRQYQAINQAAKNFAQVLLQNCPMCADLSAAIRMVRDARMTANAAIALDGLNL